MAGIFQGDIIIKSMIQLGIQDMRDNPWLIDHMLSDLTSNPYYAQKYGQKQVDACKDWFKSNEIDIVMLGRKDRERYPCIVIGVGSSPEKDDMKSMADQSTEKTVLMPNQIGKTIPYVIAPFSGFSYDDTTGLVTVPNTVDLTKIAVNMVLVDPHSSTGYTIHGVDNEGIYIEPNLTVTAATLGVLPQYQFFEARQEHAFFQESYKISCYSHGDPQVMLWLHSIALYTILRYRESLLEANGFAQSSVSSAPPISNGDVETEWCREITISGQVENSWLKSPRRFIEVAAIKEKVTPTSGNPTGYVGGIKIISNLDSEEGVIDTPNQVWTTIADDET